jgi:hypothetical protein
VVNGEKDGRRKLESDEPFETPRQGRGRQGKPARM